jgi:hypothetical protein
MDEVLKPSDSVLTDIIAYVRRERERETSSIHWVQLSRFHPKMKNPVSETLCFGRTINNVHDSNEVNNKAIHVTGCEDL